MRTLILYVLLSAICCSSLSYNKKSDTDVGLYCVIDTITDFRAIVIRAVYYVKKGEKWDSIAAARGIAFWNKLSGDFYLLTDSGVTKKTLKYEIRFDLVLLTSDTPKESTDSMNALVKHGSIHLMPANFLHIVKKLEKCEGGPPVNLDSAAALTCGANNISIKRKHKRNSIVSAHEIGHTLGLEDYEDTGLMNGYDNGSQAVYASYIRAILDYSFSNRMNNTRNRYEFRIPKGRIYHRRPDHPVGADSNNLFDTVALKNGDHLFNNTFK